MPNTSPNAPPAGARASRPRARRAALALLAAACAGAAACSSVLEVNNPNNVVEDSLASVAAAPPVANGVAGVTIRAVNAALDPYSTVTDELDFVGSQDGFFQLDVGNVSTPVIQFSDNAFQRVAEARWTADEALVRFADWDKRGVLPAGNRADWATAYLYAAVVYATIGDMFDDFTLSNRQTAAPPIGEANMRQVYDTAVAYLDRGLALAVAANNAPLRQQILATRARTKHARALWPKLNPPAPYAGAPVANPLVNDEGATADALAALALVGTGDWTFTVTPSQTGTAGNNLGNDLNQRREMRIGQAYAQPDPAAQGQNRTRVVDNQPVIVLNDPVTGQPDVALRNRVRELINGGQFLPMTLVSARELNLIVAEAALAAGNAAEARTRINLVRAFTAGTPAWDGAGPDGLTMLRHTRRVHLFLMGRRLADMYRFGDRDPRWQTGSAAFTTRGCFFPITFTERLSNQRVTTTPACEAP
jgi:hypothetical protein